jgi:hypothetical protein
MSKPKLLVGTSLLLWLGCWRFCGAAEPPAPYGPLPSERQLHWQEMEWYAFLHFSVNTFTDREWGYGDEKESVFNPAAFDPDQIVRTVKEAGMPGLVLTAKHQGDRRRLQASGDQVRSLSVALGPKPRGIRALRLCHLLQEPDPRTADKLRADF